jgi:hypothetical protein
MDRRLRHLLIPFGLLALTAPAAAQPGNYYPPAPLAPAVEPPPAPARWGIGVRLGSLEVTDADNDEASWSMAGLGAHVRLRLTEAWRLELTVDAMSTEPEAVVERDTVFANLGLHYVFTSHSDWNLYALVALGGAATELRYADGTSEEFAESLAQVGLGLERRFDSLSVGAELRLGGLALDPEQGDAVSYPVGAAPLAEESGAGSFHLHATFWF